MEILFISNIYEWVIERENIKDFILPSIITVSTILFSVFWSKHEFKREIKKEKEKLRDENFKLETIIKRNSIIVAERALIDSDEFIDVINTNYNIENGCIQQQVNIVFPELDVLNIIDPIKIEEIYLTKIDDINKIYLAISAIKEVKKTYILVQKELEKINCMLGDYDIIIMEKYSRITNLIETKIIENIENVNSNKDKFDNYFKLIHDYKSNVNNFYILKNQVDKIRKLGIIDVLFFNRNIEFHHIAGDFYLSYFKIEQELSLFHIRINYLSDRLKLYSKELHFFISTN